MDIKDTKVVNLYGGPGSSKSTTAAGVFFYMKSNGISCELVTEYAKDRVWDEHTFVLENQIYVFGKQYHRMYRLMGKVDFIISDSPILNSYYYGSRTKPPPPNSFLNLVWDIYKTMDNIDIFLTRVKPYDPIGRLQEESEARDMDLEIRSMLLNGRVRYLEIKGDKEAPQKILQHIRQEGFNYG